MSDFENARQDFNAARMEVNEKKTALVLAREETKRLEQEAGRLGRLANQGTGEEAAARLAKVRADAKQAQARYVELRREYDQARNGSLAAADVFAAFTDPTVAVNGLPDDVPMALFPLRLETRYKTVEHHGGPQQSLWVRVFPDDALVDTYQPEIAETEYTNTSLYWINRWRAGGDDAGHRAAWTALVKSHGAGRAHWLIGQIVPLNPGDEPAAAAGQHILVVTPPAPLPAAEQTAVAAFWTRVWSTAGTERDAAFAELEAALGTARAQVVEAELAPTNLYDTAVQPDPSLTAVVAFLDLPAPDTLPLSKDSWTRGARVWLLPERLVLLGFRGGKEVLRQVGEPIPPELEVGPDPSADDADQFKADGPAVEYPENLRWMVDFEEAVAKGMGFTVNLSVEDLAPEFDRLFVVGVRIGSDTQEGADELARLIGNHQASRKGFALLPQGRATNNTDAATAGYSWWENPDESFTHFFETDPGDDPTSWQTRKDGAWLAGMLGLDPEALRASPNYYGTDQAEARAMNTALWPATLGYYMEQLMEPVFHEDTVRQTRDFFTRFVLGRGTSPLVRIGRQPYGILPTTVWSRMNWWSYDSELVASHRRRLSLTPFFEKLGALTDRAADLWVQLSGQVSNVGDPGNDPQQVLLDILGLHPASAEFYQRYSQSFTQYYNTMGFSTEPVGEPLTAAMMAYINAGFLALSELGWVSPQDGELPELLEKVFLKEPNLLKGLLVAPELSDFEPLGVTRADGLNYIAWLQSAARTSHDTLRRQEGFADGTPTELLYLMLHHALDLGYVNSGLLLRRAALNLTEVQFKAERKEPQFIHLGDRGGDKSSWERLYSPEPAVTGDAALRLGDFIPQALATNSLYLREQLAALDVLKTASTGALERAFVEHLDCLNYRLDAWRLGIQAAQLSNMREETEAGFGKGGLIVGAYGWLENLAPKADVPGPAELDREAASIFTPPGSTPLLHDPTNFGYIHGPSLDHAVTAAILRNGHLANATPATPDLLAVDLSSERVRLAQQVIEGICNGQSLGALLGYRLERALHDEDDLFLDVLIYDLRRHFPLGGNRNLLTRVPTLDRISKVEARNVVDGAAFMDHIADSGEDTYPYGLSDLPPLSQFTGPGLPSAPEIGTIIDGHVALMRSVGDAVGDLAISEGVYQVVRGNFDRAAGTLDAFSKGTHPPHPEITATPRSGTTLTHRLSLHLAGGLLPGDPANTTPRAKGEPALAQWLTGQLPDPATVFARVIWRDEAADADVSLTPSMADLGLAPVDLFYLLDAGGSRDMPGFDDLLIDFAERHGAPTPRDDAIFSLEYKPAGVAGLTLFELAPLVRALRGLVLGARPLRPTDLSLQNEAGVSEDVGIILRTDKVQAVLVDLQAARPAVETFAGTVEAAVDEALDPEVIRDSARDNIDQWIRDYADIVRGVALFGLRSASLTSAVEGRRVRFKAIHAAVAEVIERWEQKRDEYDTVLIDYAGLPATATDEERQALLIRAGRIISTSVITPLPATITDLENQVAALRTAFDTALGDLRTLQGNATRVGATLAVVTNFAPTMANIDLTPFDLAAFRDGILALARDLALKTRFLLTDIDDRLQKATDKLATAATETGDKAQAEVEQAIQALIGKDFLLLPEFTVGTERLTEWDNVWSGRADLLTHLQTGPDATPFPVEDWLHGVARVRQRLRHLELVQLLGQALGAADDPQLEALQFPHRPDDAWLGLRFPVTFANGDPFVLDEDKLLYLAFFGPGAAIEPTQPLNTYCGFMLDEWIEMIPGEKENTGLSFHFDRPNAEAPQAILLATPPVHRGTWQWQDLVDTLHETLDFAHLRAVEPEHLDATALGTLLPAVLSSVTVHPITAALNLAFNNDVHVKMMEAGGE